MLAQGSAVRVSAAEYTRWLDELCAGAARQDPQGLGRARQVTADDASGGSLVIPVVQLRQRRAAAAAGARLGRGQPRRCITPRTSRRIISTWRRTPGCATASRPMRSSTSARTARSSGSTARTSGCPNEDAPDALIADLPDLYIYNVDVVGEGLVARRRGMATLVDHMVPPFKKGGLYRRARGAQRDDQRLRHATCTRIRSWPRRVGEADSRAGHRARHCQGPRASICRSRRASTTRSCTRFRTICSSSRARTFRTGCTPSAACRRRRCATAPSTPSSASDRSLLPKQRQGARRRRWNGASSRPARASSTA